MKKHEKQLNELFEMWNKEHLENIALSEKVIELKIELANLKMQIHENSLQKGNKSRKEKNTFDKKVEAFKTEFIALHNRRIEAARRKSIKELKEMSC